MGAWFETGNKMADGTPRSAYVEEVEFEAVTRQGWKKVDDSTPSTDTVTNEKGVTGTKKRKKAKK